MARVKAPGGPAAEGDPEPRGVAGILGARGRRADDVRREASES